MLACACPDIGIGIVNIGSGKGIPVKDLADTILKIVGCEMPIVERRSEFRPLESDILELIADIRRAQAVLKWMPRISLSHGLRGIASTQSAI
jgi:nucleoside-diphosphate-sugar epimerase